MNNYVYGVFNEYGIHMVTFDYGKNTKERVEELARRISSPLNYCYAKELSMEEYYDRLKLLADKERLHD